MIVHDEQFSRSPAPFRWVAVVNPDDGELAGLASELKLSPDASAALTRPHKSSRFTRLGNGGAAAIRTVAQARGNYSDVGAGMVAVYGDGFVITVTDTDAELMDDTVEAVHAMGDVTGPASIVHCAAAAVLDQFGDAESTLGDNLDALEKRLFSSDPPISEDIYRLKSAALRLRRGIAGIAAALDDSATPAAANLNVQAHYVHGQFDAYDSALTDILSTHLAEVSVRQNDDMRKMSAWAAILVLPTVLTGIYGMNFSHMPELTWTFGYPLCIAVMVAVCAGLYIQFRRIQWL